MLWTVVRWPNGLWSTGGKIDDPDYAECEKWQIEADSRKVATSRAQSRRSRARRASTGKDTDKEAK